MKDMASRFITLFAMIFTASVLVSCLWNYWMYNAGTADWGMALRNAVTFGIVLTVSISMKRKSVI